MGIQKGRGRKCAGNNDENNSLGRERTASKVKQSR